MLLKFKIIQDYFRFIAYLFRQFYINFCGKIDTKKKLIWKFMEIYN